MIGGAKLPGWGIPSGNKTLGQEVSVGERHRLLIKSSDIIVSSSTTYYERCVQFGGPISSNETEERDIIMR